ncbi:MAG: metallophosphoesterase [Bacteroidota bacterium]|nr:metallophosphoesterase [Bacteroidota bacterium]
MTVKKEFTIAHLSDLHLSPEFFPDRSLWFRSVLDHLLLIKVDHIIITGDVTNQAKKSEFEEFREIVQQYHLMDSKKLTVIIGNHDIFGGPYTAEDVLEFPGWCKATKYEEKIKEFYQSTKETFYGSKFLSRDSIFPFVKILGDIAIVGINSIARWDSFRNPLGSNGMVDDEQFDQLESFLQSSTLKGKRIFIAIHHHFHKTSFTACRSKLERLWTTIESSTMKLHKKKRLLKLFHQSKIEGVLHGHVHHSDEYVRRKIQCFNAGGTLIPSKNAERSCHLFQVKGNEVLRRSHSLTPSIFDAATSTVKQRTRLLAVA